MPNTPIQFVQPATVSGFQLTYASATTFTISAGMAVDTANNINVQSTSTLTVNTATKGANGLDTGAIANNTMYAVYVMGSSTNAKPTSAIMTTSMITPALPSGFDNVKRVGWVLTNGSAQILKFYQSGNVGIRYYQYDAPITVLSSGTQTSFTEVDLSTAVPLTFGKVKITTVYTPAAAGNIAKLKPFGATSDFINQVGSVASVSQTGIIDIIPVVDSAKAKLQYLVVAGTLSASVLGYEDQL